MLTARAAAVVAAAVLTVRVAAAAAAVAAAAAAAAWSPQPAPALAAMPGLQEDLAAEHRPPLLALAQTLGVAPAPAAAPAPAPARAPLPWAAARAPAARMVCRSSSPPIRAGTHTRPQAPLAAAAAADGLRLAGLLRGGTLRHCGTDSAGTRAPLAVQAARTGPCCRPHQPAPKAVPAPAPEEGTDSPPSAPRRARRRPPLPAARPRHVAWRAGRRGSSLSMSPRRAQLVFPGRARARQPRAQSRMRGPLTAQLTAQLDVWPP